MVAGKVGPVPWHGVYRQLNHVQFRDDVVAELEHQRVDDVFGVVHEEDVEPGIVVLLVDLNAFVEPV